MSYIVNGIKIKKVGVLLEPSTYDADITPVDMQHGRTAYVKGKKLVGTGKAFEFATYGLYEVRKITDDNGIEKYGFKFKATQGTNVILISPTQGGDVLIQFSRNVKVEENVSTKIGTNQTTSGEVYAYQSGDYIYIFITSISNQKTQAIIFVGKDNEV